MKKNTFTQENKIKVMNILFIIKAILVIFICMIGSVGANFSYYVFPFTEVILVFIFTFLISKRHPVMAYIFNSCFCLILLLQQCLLYFSGEYATLILLENISAFSALGNSVIFYTVLIAAVIIVSFLPLRLTIEKSKSLKINLKFMLAALLIYSILVGTTTGDTMKPSPIASLGFTISEMISSQIKIAELRTIDSEELKDKFYLESIEQGFESDDESTEHPNVILIFAEGMSAEVIDRHRPEDQVANLTLTPNINKFYDRSIVFENYINHTAATYRGLWGQLFSGYLLRGGRSSNLDGLQDVDAKEVSERMNTDLISLPSIFNDLSYATFMINTEPENPPFTAFVNELHFNEVITADDHSRMMTDKEAFELLLNTVKTHEEPFFAAMYTVATHVGFDSPDEKYGDGSDPVLNRFYNFDVQFGNFLDEFLESDLASNTIIIFTTDHASANVPEYLTALNSEADSFIYSIPLLIYQEGIEHEIIDARGRNSLCLAPTILDFIGARNHENYFLGTSLFEIDEDNPFATISALGTVYYNSNSVFPPEQINLNDPKYTEVISRIEEYYAITIE